MVKAQGYQVEAPGLNPGMHFYFLIFLYFPFLSSPIFSSVISPPPPPIPSFFPFLLTSSLHFPFPPLHFSFLNLPLLLSFLPPPPFFLPFFILSSPPLFFLPTILLHPFFLSTLLLPPLFSFYLFFSLKKKIKMAY